MITITLITLSFCNFKGKLRKVLEKYKDTLFFARSNKSVNEWTHLFPVLHFHTPWKQKIVSVSDILRSYRNFKTKAVNYFRKKLHLRCSTGFWMQLWIVSNTNLTYILDCKSTSVFETRAWCYAQRYLLFSGYITFHPPAKYLFKVNNKTTSM